MDPNGCGLHYGYGTQRRLALGLLHSRFPVKRALSYSSDLSEAFLEGFMAVAIVTAAVVGFTMHPRREVRNGGAW